MGIATASDREGSASSLAMNLKSSVSASQPEPVEKIEGGYSDDLPELDDDIEMNEGRLVTITFRKRPLRRHSGCREGNSEARIAIGGAFANRLCNRII